MNWTKEIRMLNWILGCLVALVSSAWSTSAQAADWTGIFPGVEYSQWTVSDPNRITAVRVNLCQAGVSIRATKHSERGQIPSAFGAAVGAEVVINGDLYIGGYLPINLAIGDGERWPNSVDREDREFIAFGAGRVLLSKDWNTVTDYSWMNDAVGGAFTVLDNNVVPAFSGAHCTARHPRTIAGFSEDERTLFMVVVDGRSSSSRGMTCAELGNLMQGMGAWNAISLDGGGSTAMWVRNKGVVNNPSDGSQRVVANHLAVLAHGDRPPEACNDLGSSFKTTVNATDFNKQGVSDGVPDVLVGDEFEANLTFKDVGAIVLPAVLVDYDFVAPHLVPLTYSIESDHPVHDQQTWVINSSDSAVENPPKDAMGAHGTLMMHAFSPQESKRVKVIMRAEQYNIGELEHPNVRAWLHHIEGLYGEQSEWDQPPTNANFFGEIIQDQIQVDILSPREWQFNGGEGQLEGWTACDGEGAGFTNNAEHTAIVAEGAQAAHCAESPAWTSVNSATYDQMVIRLSAAGAGGNLRFSWKTGQQLYDAARAVGFVPVLGPDTKTYVLDLAQIGEWSETVEGLKLFWAPGAFDRVAIDGIFFQDSATHQTSSATEVYVEQPGVEFLDELDPEDGPAEPGESDSGLGSMSATGSAGCGCGSTGTTSSSALLLILVGLGWFVRRRVRRT